MVKIKIINWEKYNPRKDIKSMSWFKLSNNIYNSPSLHGLSNDSRWMFICLLCISSIKSCSDIDVDVLYICDRAAIHPLTFNKHISVLEKHKLIQVLENNYITESVMQNRINKSRIDKNRLDKSIYTADTIAADAANDFDFEKLWNLYPRKLGKRGAFRHFKATVKNENDWNDINKALKNYLIYCEDKEIQFIKHGSTWFYNWQDWIFYEEKNNKQDSNDFKNQFTEYIISADDKKGEIE